ncbi:hypothetical protein NG895_14745 [Aeoliella sp. ICT_H6.2]|uniref:Uncharacterized protein n=1 Tax=Aeoliella straminimaris TaxID=2954799 RepID=A0A9X2FA08_9BACT|nr:hypothetical protein [Aeoliella straminimaris]MCO6045167.1 hypothetical protein [Aeoliella straminimaris]
MATGWRSRLPGISLRELLGIIAFVAVAFASLLNASEGWAIAVFGLTIALTIVLAIVAVAERGSRQTAAAGALIAMLAYAVLWTQQPETTLEDSWDQVMGVDPVLTDKGFLLTSRALYAAWHRVNGTYMVEWETGRVVEQTAPNYPPAYGQGNVPQDQVPPNWSGGGLIYKGLPVPEHFLAVGHCLWAILLGYLGGKFAVWIFARRIAREENVAGGSPT